MASAPRPGFPAPVTVSARVERHSAVVRITHWLTALCVLALLITGANLVVSHPRFYWGETGNVLTPALFQIPIPASRAAVRTGYGYVLPDQNGWSRSLHFEASWLLVFTGVVYIVSLIVTRHLRSDLLPARSALSWQSVSKALVEIARPQGTGDRAGAESYNVIQRLTYLTVVFALTPLMIWTGLAMSPAVVSVFPHIVTVQGGHQSARTIHFFAGLSIFVFLIGHIVMVCRSGFRNRTGAMITGRLSGNLTGNKVRR